MQNNYIPLAERLRPKRIDDFIGQRHLVGDNGVIRKMLANQKISSMIFWGQAGVGKTTLAMLIAHTLNKPFFTLSAISSGVKEVREVIEKAHYQSGTVLFIDEIHRFNKSQQDALLGAVEKGVITLIGATTENPSFEVNSALLSRCHVYRLYPLEIADLQQLVTNALQMLNGGLDRQADQVKNHQIIQVSETEALFRLSGGDGRKLLNILETAVNFALESTSQTIDNQVLISDEIIQQAVQQKTVLYDKSGEQHYDIVSAFIKSMRGSDPNATVYWLARMIEGGEDPVFIARRMLILASEDIGNANPTALALATNCFQAVSYVGYPEARIILSQTAIYLATSSKSNASYMAIEQALELVRQTGDLPVPMHLRNAPTKLMKNEGYGKGYMYAHDYPQNFAFQEYLPEKISGTKLYEPLQNQRENEMRARLKQLWKEKYGY
ncbi:MAG: replication-associated recombination protein A [Thermoflexibacter sp.]|nr:replication-associated recombination protein A [Thermoflexibacter sp.]